MSKCKICGKDGFHKLSCPTQKITLFLEDELATQIGDLSDDEFEHNCEKLSKHFIQKQALIDMMQADEKDGLYNKAIPTLEGDEAEEFIRKADEALKAEKTDWTLQFERAARILEKSRIISMKQIKNGNVNIKCERCGGCGYHKMSCSLNKVTFLNLDSRIAKRILHYAKSATQKVKRNKDVEP